MRSGFVVIEKDLINKRYFDRIWFFDSEHEAVAFSDSKNAWADRQRDSEVDFTYHYQATKTSKD